MSNMFRDESDDLYLHSDMDEDHYDDYDERDEDDELPIETPHEDKHDAEQGNQENINDMIQRDKKWLVQRKVINEAMIREAVREELFLDYDKVYVPDADQIELRDTKALVLSFRSIDSINNLHGLQNLRKLQLDNNLIEKITNLDHLVNLEWLDLSFNFIKEIEGLDKLTKLKDLTLFNNRISSLAGLENLTNLTILSVGNNYIRDLEQIRNLRRLKSLRALNLRGNPIAKEDDYIHTALAYLPDLKYLDYQLVSTKQLKDAYDKKMEVVLEMVQQEQQEQEAAESDKEKQSYLATLDNAGLKILRDLFDTLVKRDKEMGRLQILPGFMIILDQYRQQFVTIVDELITECLQQQDLKKEEEECFAAAITRVISDSEERLLNMKSVYEHDIKIAIASKNGEALVAAKRAALALSDSMMEVEMESVRAISTMMEEYVEVYAKIGKNTENKISNGFALLADCIKKYERDLHDHAHALLDRLNSDGDGNSTTTTSSGTGAAGTGAGAGAGAGAVGEGATATATATILGLTPATTSVSQWPPELISLLNDKDQLTNAIVATHDHHYALVLKAEEEVRGREETTTEAHLRNVHLAECKRNRDRTNDIFAICEGFIQRINEQGRLLFKMG